MDLKIFNLYVLRNLTVYIYIYICSHTKKKKEKKNNEK